MRVDPGDCRFRLVIAAGALEILSSPFVAWPWRQLELAKSRRSRLDLAKTRRSTASHLQLVMAKLLDSKSMPCSTLTGAVASWVFLSHLA